VTEFGSLNHAPARQSSAFNPEFCSFSCSVLLLTALLSNLNIYSPFRLQTTDIMVTQPSTCLRLSDNTAGAITWWRRLPEKFCRNPIYCHWHVSNRFWHFVVNKIYINILPLLYMKFYQLVLRKIAKNCCNQMSDFTAKMY